MEDWAERRQGGWSGERRIEEYILHSDRYARSINISWFPEY
jgi:hypothetical protein